jgi:uncharacterized protein YndB with AHSA1/START domain
VSVRHNTFVIERSYDAAPARVFGAFADPTAKSQWWAGPEEEFKLDFRVGGRELGRGGHKGQIHTFAAIYQDIVQDERIVYPYDMHLDDQRISVSLTTIELTPAGAGTRLVLTEQGAYFDGADDPADRERGTAALLDALGASLASEPAARMS